MPNLAPPPIDWSAWADAIHRGTRSAFSSSNDGDPRSPFWIALHARPQDATLHDVRPLLEACLAQGVSLYDASNPLPSMVGVRDAAKFAWWLEQGADPGANGRIDGLNATLPLWFGLIDHARLDLLDVLSEHPHWPRLARQRGSQQEGAFERWARLIMTGDSACNGDNPDLRTPDHGLEPYEREDGTLGWVRVDTPPPGLDTAGRIRQALTVWHWLVEHVPMPNLDPVWGVLWRENVHNDTVMQAVWRTLRQEPPHGVNPASMVASMNRAWASFVQAYPANDWRLEKAGSWKRAWERGG